MKSSLKLTEKIKSDLNADDVANEVYDIIL